jgi:quercetin dioxygenase-like cupin family protein
MGAPLTGWGLILHPPTEGYGPGGYSPGHTHPKSAFISATVLEGAIRSQVNDGQVTIYKAGQSFSERPGDRHGVSANANETELTIPPGN